MEDPDTLEQRLAESLCSLQLPITPADLSRALRATLAAIKESDGKRPPQASSPDWESMDSTAIQTEAETSLLLLERRLEKEPAQRVALLKEWLSRVGLPLASSGRGEARGGQDVVLRAVHELTASALDVGEVEALEGLCVGLLQGLASHRAADSNDPHDAQHCLPASVVAAFLRACDGRTTVCPPPVRVMREALSLIARHPEASVRQLLTCTLLPPMAPFLHPDTNQTAEVSSMREELWSLVLTMQDAPDERREMWAALVVLYDALVGPLELGAKTQFWTLLQAGLCSPCDLSRKRALHVLERYLAPHAPTPPQASAKGGKAKQPTLTPQEQEAKATCVWWWELVQVVSTFEMESEGHLVEQTWPLLIKLVGSVTSCPTITTSVADLITLPPSPPPSSSPSSSPSLPWHLPRPSMAWVEVALRGPLSTPISTLKKRYLARFVDPSIVPLHHCLGLLQPSFMLHTFLPLTFDAHHNRNGLGADITRHVADFLATYLTQLPSPSIRQAFLISLLQMCADRRWGTQGVLTLLGAFTSPVLTSSEKEYPCLGNAGIMATRAFLACRLIAANRQVVRRLLALILAMLTRFTDYSPRLPSPSDNSSSKGKEGEEGAKSRFVCLTLLLSDVPAELLTTTEALLPFHHYLLRVQSAFGESWLMEQTRDAMQAYLHTPDETSNDSGSSCYQPLGQDLSSLPSDPQARQLSLLCLLLTPTPAHLSPALSPLLSLLSKAPSHPYLPASSLRRSLLLLHHLCAALLPSPSLHPSLTSLLLPSSADLMHFLTSSALASLQAPLPPSPLAITSDVIEELSSRFLCLTLLGHVLQLLGPHNRSVLDAALSGLDRARDCLFDLNDASVTPSGQTMGDTILAKVQAAALIERLLANAPVGLYAEVVSRQWPLQCALLGLPRGHDITPDFVPLSGAQRSSGVLVQVFSDRMWRSLTLLTQIHAKAPPATSITTQPHDTKHTDLVVGLLCQSLDTTSRRSMADLLFYLTQLVTPYATAPLTHAPPSAIDDEDIQLSVIHRLDTVWDVCWRILKERAFRPLLVVVVMHAFFCPPLMRLPFLCKGDEAPLRRYFRVLLAMGYENKMHVVLNLVARCISVWEVDSSSCVHFVEELSELVVLKEDEPEMMQIADANDEETALGVEATPLPHPVLRLALLSFLTRLQDQLLALPSTDRPTHPLQHLMDGLMLRLLEDDRDQADNNTWTPNSHACNRKLRTWQALALLVRTLHEGFIPTLDGILWPLIARFSVLSVRYHIEVFVAHAVQSFPTQLWPTLLAHVANYAHKPQVITSKLCIIGWAAFSKDAPPLPPPLQDQLLTAILPWLGSTHGYCRILTQLLAFRLLPRVLERYDTATGIGQKDKGTLEDVAVTWLRNTMTFLTDHREVVRMRERESRAFLDLTLDERVSFAHLMSHEANEWRELSAVHVLDLIKQSMVALHEELLAEDQLCGLETSLTHDHTTHGQQEGDTPGEGGVLSLQRKIITSDLLGLATAEQRRMDNLNARGKVKQSVIVCASLIDKIPNLAGLARTCEVFAASKLVIPNTKIMDMDMFQQISVAAANHVVIEEVKEKDTAAFLRRCKAQGYSIVGLEQTSTSEALQCVKLPKRVVLLLGAEKEGIPVDLLQDVDLCVEIPQLGITRSLNVHVSGALLLWEYTRQHAPLQAESGTKGSF